MATQPFRTGICVFGAAAPRSSRADVSGLSGARRTGSRMGSLYGVGGSDAVRFAGGSIGRRADGNGRVSELAWSDGARCRDRRFSEIGPGAGLGTNKKTASATCEGFAGTGNRISGRTGTAGGCVRGNRDILLAGRSCGREETA